MEKILKIWYYTPKKYRSIVLKFNRLIKKLIKESLNEFPAIFIAGARQVGKSTLAMELSNNYITFDDINVYLSAKNDPIGFISSLKTPVVLDEIQKLPELINVIKRKIDENRIPNQFILTGSINVLRFSKIKESLAGRMAIFELYPLSVYELFNKNGNMIDNIFSGIFLNKKPSLSYEN